MLIRALLLLLVFYAVPAGAQSLDYTNFAHIPVQHEGRIKPIDTFARSFLNLISGHDSVEGMNAESWLAETLFDPAQAMQRPVFRVFRPSLLNLPPREKKYYSYVELAPSLQAKAQAFETLLGIDEKNWSEDQKELMRLQEASVLYTQLLRSFSFILPLNIEPPDALNITAERPFTLQQYKRHEQAVRDRLKTIIRQKGDDPAGYSEAEKSIAAFVFQMQVLEQGGADNVLFRILPGQGREWFSPWALTQAGQGSPESAKYLEIWRGMATAYLKQDAAVWQKSTRLALEAGQSYTPESHVGLEVLYNQTHPLLAASLFYFAAFLFLILLALQGAGPWRALASASLVAACLAHGLAILMRILILSRPPVGTLYESIIFVALICAIAGLFIEFLRKDTVGIMTGALGGLLLLIAAQGFVEDDSMKMLVAVLNTNFWLGTHVLCITIGYAWCFIAAMLAHIWLARAAMGHDSAGLTAPIKTIGLIALLFTAVGTILGGIWADQSWGRFWGWDPKENGALLIVLWLIWLLHGQISGHISRLNYIAGTAMLSVVVALAWFGVNLLSIGLHSYGFITGVAAALGAFCMLEILAIGGAVYFIRRREGTA